MAKDKGLTALEKVMIAAKAADSKKATDIVIQDVRELVSVTDFFVIVTAQNNRQVAAVLDAIDFHAGETYRIGPKGAARGKNAYALGAS